MFIKIYRSTCYSLSLSAISQLLISINIKSSIIINDIFFFFTYTTKRQLSRTDGERSIEIQVTWTFLARFIRLHEF